MFNEELSQEQEITSSHFSSVSYGYLLNHWRGISPLWTSFHLSSQSKHGCTKPYEDWRTINTEKSCVKSPPKTQLTLKNHHQSLWYCLLMRTG